MIERIPSSNQHWLFKYAKIEPLIANNKSSYLRVKLWRNKAEHFLTRAALKTPKKNKHTAGSWSRVKLRTFQKCFLEKDENLFQIEVGFSLLILGSIENPAERPWQ